MPAPMQPPPARAGSGYNFSAVIVAPPGSGKTTVVRELVAAHLRAHPHGLALVHDPHRQCVDFCAPYETVADWQRAARAAGSKPFPHGASLGGSAVDVTRVAIDIGRARNTAHRVRVPILLAYDETSLLTSSGASYMGELDIQLLSNRRHWGIGPIYNVQRATSLTEGFYTMATDVYVFTQPSARRTDLLEEYLGLAPGALRSLVGAPPFRYRHWQAGRGLV